MTVASGPRRCFRFAVNKDFDRSLPPVEGISLGFRRRDRPQELNRILDRDRVDAGDRTDTSSACLHFTKALDEIGDRRVWRNISKQHWQSDDTNGVILGVSP